MSIDRVVILVTGSRALDLTDAAMEWASEKILATLCEYPERNELVVTGDARGPDVHARGMADNSLVWSRYGYVSVRGNAPILDRWCSDPLPRPDDRDGWKQRLLARARAMVAWVAAESGVRRCLALIAPWSRTQGTQYTARHAREAGIAVTELVCPAAFGPDGGVR